MTVMLIPPTYLRGISSNSFVHDFSVDLNALFLIDFQLLLYRMVNGLLKTAQGVPPGTTTTLLPPQEATIKLEAMKCLIAILRSMGDWMNKQLRIPDPHSNRKFDQTGAENSPEPGNLHLANGNGDEPFEGSDSHSESSSEASDVLTIEQRRAYKLELQVTTSCSITMKFSFVSLYLLIAYKTFFFCFLIAGRYISV